MEAEYVLLRCRQFIPITAGRLEQAVSTDNIGLYEVGRSVDGAIHMGLGRQVHNRRRPKLGKHQIECSTITDIHLIEAVA
ncbi:hypothetical protein D3C81_1847700 [compost metagenome]